MTVLAVVEDDPLPAQFDRAFSLLDVATTPAEFDDVQTIFESLRVLAKKAGLAVEVQNRAAAGALRAIWRGGRVLAEVPKLAGNRPGSHDATPLAALGFDKHKSSRWQRIASLSQGELEAYIDSAVRNGRELTTAGALQLARLVKAADPVERPQVVSTDVDATAGLPGLEGAQFATIVSDPPWQYDNRGTRNAAAKHYPTMTVADLCDLPVEANAADNAHLYLWTTNAFLEDSFSLMRAWGFTYKSHLAWVKPQMGMGNYFRISHEHVLFGVRGKAPTRARNLMSWFSADRGRHSAKPPAFYELVERASDGPYLDMFSRSKRLGWTGWGNEA